jgi:alkylation response protein AidB-like acyl-CoA dehydrogenase
MSVLLKTAQARLAADGALSKSASDQAALRSFLAEILPPDIVSAINHADEPRPDLVAAIGQRGFLANCFESQVTQEPLRMRFSELDSFITQLALTKHWGLTLSSALHVGVFLPMLSRLARSDHHHEVVRSGLKGELLGTVAATDSQAAGSDFMGMETTATFEGSIVRLQGQKTFITSATMADAAIVFARWRPGRHFANYCALLVPTNLAGVSSEPIAMAVMRGAGIGRLRFDDVKLPKDAVLGRREFGMRYFLEHIATERLIGGIWASAVAKQSLCSTHSYLAAHQVGQRALWTRDAVRQRFASAVVEYVQLRALVDETIRNADITGSVDQLRATSIKAAVPGVMERIAGTCLQLRGARGLLADSESLRSLIELRAFAIGGGSTETMLEVVADLWASSSMVEQIDCN